MWRYNDGFFEASFYNEDVSIESNIGPKHLQNNEGILVHDYTRPSVHAHHYVLYTKKDTQCDCYAPATNVMIETFHTAKTPSAEALRTYFNNTITVREPDTVCKSCAICNTHWSPMRYYGETHYTRHCNEASITISFPPALLEQAQVVSLQRTMQQTKLYIQKQTCTCWQEAGKFSLALLTPFTEQTFFEQQFHVSVVDIPLETASLRCQTCIPAPANWAPSAVRVGHVEKYTQLGIMYSTFLPQTIAPTVIYQLEPHIFILAQPKQMCDCLEDVGQLETTTAPSLHTLVECIEKEFNVYVTPLSHEPSTTCDTCTEHTYMLP